MIDPTRPLDPVPLDRIYDVATEVWGPTVHTYIEHIGKKRCTHCGEVKPLDQFYRLANHRLYAGRRATCKPCHHRKGVK